MTPRSVEDFIKDIRLTDDGMLVLWGIIATRSFPTDDFGKQVVGAFQEHFRLALVAYAAEQVAQARGEEREACAKLMDRCTCGHKCPDPADPEYWLQGGDCFHQDWCAIHVAAAIRART